MIAFYGGDMIMDKLFWISFCKTELHLSETTRRNQERIMQSRNMTKVCALVEKFDVDLFSKTLAQYNQCRESCKTSSNDRYGSVGHRKSKKLKAKNKKQKVESRKQKESTQCR